MSVRTFLNCEWDTVQGAVSCLEKISPGCHHRGDTPGAIGKECLVKNPTPVSFVGWHDNLSVTEETDVVFGSSTVAFPANLSGVLRWPTEILIAKSWHDSPACEIRTRSFTCLLKCWGHDAWLSARCPTMASWAMRMLALIIETCSSFFFFFFLLSAGRVVTAKIYTDCIFGCVSVVVGVYPDFFHSCERKRGSHRIVYLWTIPAFQAAVSRLCPHLVSWIFWTQFFSYKWFDKKKIFISRFRKSTCARQINKQCLHFEHQKKIDNPVQLIWRQKGIVFTLLSSPWVFLRV